MFTVEESAHLRRMLRFLGWALTLLVTGVLAYLAAKYVAVPLWFAVR